MTFEETLEQALEASNPTFDLYRYLEWFSEKWKVPPLTNLGFNEYLDDLSRLSR